MPRKIDESKKYALLVFVYGAPEYQNVDQLFTTDFVKAYLPSSYNVITALAGIKKVKMHRSQLQ